VPQLGSFEQKELFSILVKHLDPNQLARVLKHNGLPEIDELVGNGNHRDRTEKVVKELSKRFRIVELVEGAIGELDDSCPPLQSWIKNIHDELIRRRDNPSVIEKVGHAFRVVQDLRSCMVLAIIISLSIIVLVGTFIYPLSKVSVIKRVERSNDNSTTTIKAITPSVDSGIERRKLSSEVIYNLQVNNPRSKMSEQLLHRTVATITVIYQDLEVLELSLQFDEQLPNDTGWMYWQDETAQLLTNPDIENGKPTDTLRSRINLKQSKFTKEGLKLSLDGQQVEIDLNDF